MIITAISIILGGAIGCLIPWLDRIVYIFILHPEAQIAQYLKYQIEKKQYQAAWQNLNTRAKEFDKLTTRSLLFQLAWTALAFFAVTSSAGWFGKTLVLSLGLRILFEEWRDYFYDRIGLKKKLFWQAQREWNDWELKIYLIGKTLVIAWLLRLYI